MKTDFSHCRNFFIFHPSPLVMCLIWVSYSLHFYKFCNLWCLNLIFVFSSSLPFFPFASFPVLFLYFFYSFLSYILIFFSFKLLFYIKLRIRLSLYLSLSV